MIRLREAVAAASGFLLDFDGVLADSEPWFYLSWARALRSAGIGMEPSEYWLNWSSRGEGLDGLCRRRGVIVPDPEGLRAMQRRTYSGFCAKGSIALFQEARPLLQALVRIGKPFAIASNTEKPLVEAILAGGGAPDVTVVGGEGLPPKPAPDIFLKAAAGLGLEPGSTLVVEDAEKGIRAARAGGFGSVLVRTGLNRGMAFEVEPDFEAEDLRELLAVFEGEAG